jgi:hypothetical protein
VITDARKVLHTTTADEHDRVLLKVVTFAADVRGDLETIDEANAAHLA